MAETYRCISCNKTDEIYEVNDFIDHECPTCGEETRWNRTTYDFVCNGCERHRVTLDDSRTEIHRDCPVCGEEKEFSRSL